MNQRKTIGIVFIGIAMILYLLYLSFLGYAFIFSTWTPDIYLISTALYLFTVVIMPFIGFLALGIILLNSLKESSRRKLTLLVFLLIYIPIVLFDYGIRINNVIYEATYTFTKDKWENTDKKDRGSLIDSFREKYPLVGENIEYATTLLGEPDIEESGVISYEIGHYKRDTFFNFNYVITFGEDFLITDEEVVRVIHGS